MATVEQTRDEFAAMRLQDFPNPQRLIDQGKPASNSYREITMPAGNVWLIDEAPTDPKLVWAGHERLGHLSNDLHFRADSRAAFDEFATQQGWLANGVEVATANISYIDNLVLDPGDRDADPVIEPIMAGFHANVRLT